MKLTGTVHLINKEDNQWIFKYDVDKKPSRVPFIFYTGKYEDGQSLDCYLETVAGIERAKPLFPIPNTLQDQMNLVEQSTPKTEPQS